MEGALRRLAPAGLKVIETLRFEQGAGFIRLQRHMARCAATCARLGVPFQPAQMIKALQGAAPPPLARMRVTVDLDGGLEAMAAPFAPQAPGTVWRLALSPHRLDPADPWLQVKTTRRALYDDARACAPDDIDEVVFANTAGRLCEGAITNLFFDFGDGLVTPPLSDGLLPGVLREEMLATGACREASVALADLPQARRLFVGNSLRGLIAATLAAG